MNCLFCNALIHTSDPYVYYAHFKCGHNIYYAFSNFKNKTVNIHFKNGIFYLALNFVQNITIISFYTSERDDIKIDALISKSNFDSFYSKINKYILIS